VAEKIHGVDYGCDHGVCGVGLFSIKGLRVSALLSPGSPRGSAGGGGAVSARRASSDLPSGQGRLFVGDARCSRECGVYLCLNLDFEPRLGGGVEGTEGDRSPVIGDRWLVEPSVQYSVCSVQWCWGSGICSHGPAGRSERRRAAWLHGAGQVMTDRKKRRDAIVVTALLACVAVVGFWHVMAVWSGRPFRLYELTAEDFAGFQPQSPTWSIRPRPVVSNPTEPNIVAYALRPRAASAADSGGEASSPAPILVRLVHGYNMRDCMRLRRFEVELIVEGRGSRVGGRGRESEVRSQESEVRSQNSAFGDLGPGGSLPVQVWRLTSPTGDRSIWITSMIRAGDFSATDVDVRSMAFPRVGALNDPGWAPQGVTRETLRHPIRDLRRILIAKWNGARHDVATFLKLKQPVWASEELLTLVSAYEGPSVERDQESGVAQRVLAAHALMYGQFRKWRVQDLGGQDGRR